MAGEWKETSLAAVMDVKHGFAFPGENIRDEPPGDILLTPGNFAIGGGFKGDKFKYFDGEVPEDYVLKEGELVLTMTDLSKQADTLGYPATVPKPRGPRFLHNQRLGKVLIKRGAELDRGFLFYLLRTAEYRNEVLASATGTTVKHTSPGRILAHKASIPPLAEQKAIAAVLGALDDKIELNRRMNATLEAMARALFQSWFVDFDPVRAKLDGRKPIGLDPATAALFPAHFDHKAEGVVPTGWRATTLGEVIEISDSKRIPLSGRERGARQGKYPYHGAASVMDYVDDFLFDGIYALMGEDGSVINDDGTPVLQYVWGKFWVNNHAHVLRGKNGISTEHLLLHLKGSNVAPFVNGAVQPKLNQGNMNRIPFMLPPPEIGQAFAKTIEPLFAQIRANTDQSRTLATLRDTLLPKLLSGELSVAEATGNRDFQVQPGMPKP